VKESLTIKEAIAYLIVVLLLLSSLGVAFGWDYYPASYNRSFQNYSYLGFNHSSYYISHVYVDGIDLSFDATHLIRGPTQK